MTSNPTRIDRPQRWARAAALLALFGCVFAASAQQLDIAYEQFTLPNGLRVVVHEDRKAPIVAVSVWYHVGSKDEVPGKTGFAHLFEHLMFQGSENYSDEYFKPFEDVGATSMNGTTWLDRTNYFQNVPTTALDMALWMESDRMGHFLGAVTQELLDEQRGVVQNEKRQRDNQPYGQAFELIQRHSFPEGHPYRWSTIGSMEDLEAATLEDVKAWFREYYGPNNAVLVLAGDIDVETARAKAQQYFGDIPPGPPLQRLETWIAERDATTRAHLQDRVSQTRLYRSWNVAELGDDDVERLQLFARVLGGGKTSRLYQRLVQGEQLADSVSAGVMSFELASLFNIQVDVKQGVDPERVERIVDEELQRLLREGPESDEVERARTLFRAGFVRGIERVGGFGGKADVLAECTVYLKDPGCFRHSLAVLDAATADSVQATAQRWLAQGDFNLRVDPFPTLQAEGAGVDRSSGVPAVESFPDLSLPEVQRATLSNGIELQLAERSSVPVVQVQLLFDAGYAADVDAPLGTSSFTMAMLDEGTRSRDALEIATEMETLGAQIGAGSGLDSSSITLSALVENLPASLELLADIARNPAFDDDEFARVKAQWLAGIAREKTQPASLALRTLPPLLYGKDHPYGIPFTGSGTEESIGALDTDVLRRFQQRWLRPDNLTILVVGDTTMAQIRPLLERQFGDWRVPSEPLPQKSLTRVELPSQTRVFLMDKPGAAQSTILAGHVAPPIGDEENLAIEMMNSVLGGTFTARLNMNLREDKSWAYGAYTMFNNARGQRPWIIWAPVQTDRTADSIVEIRRELSEYLGERPATSEEIARIKANDIRSLPGSYETAAAVLGTLSGNVVYDRPDDYVETLKQRTEALSDQAVRAAAERVLEPEALTWVIVGDLQQIEAPLRELFDVPVRIIDSDGSVLR